MALIQNKWYANWLTGIPQIDNAWGALTTMLDAVLVNGFNVKVATSLARIDTTATTYSPAHGYVVNQIIRVSGWDQPEYNGEFKVTRITTDTYDFEVVGAPASPATGPGTAKAAPLGFEIAFTATNKRAYRSLNLSGNRPYLRVDDNMPTGFTTTWSKFARVTMAEAMTDINTFAGARAPFNSAAPTRNETPTGSGTNTYGGWYKWFYATPDQGQAYATTVPAGPRAFDIAGDDRGFIFAVNTMSNQSQARACYVFSDFTSFKAGDGFNTLLCANDLWEPANTGWYPGYGSNFPTCWDSMGKVLMRDYSQIGTTVNVSFTTLNVGIVNLISGNTQQMPFPHGPDYSLLILPLFLVENRRNDIRGQLPGIYFTPQMRPYDDGTIVENISGYPGRRFLCMSIANSSSLSYTDTGRIFVDLTGPWR